MRRSTARLALFLSASLLGSPWDGAVLADEKPPAEEASPLAEISKLQWRLGVIARDEQHDPIKAAHYFYQAARSARQAQQETLAEDILLAAQNAAGAVDRTFLHEGIISGATFSPDGQFVLTWSGAGRPQDQTARLWNVEDGNLLRTFDQKASIFGAVFSPDSRYIFTWGKQTTPGEEGLPAWLWDRTKDQPLREFQSRFGKIEDAVFTADSSSIFVWSNEIRSWTKDLKGHLWLWNIKKDEAVLSLENYVETPTHRGAFEFTILQPDRPHLKNKKDFDAWRADLKHKKQFVQSLPRVGEVVGATFSPDGDFVVTWNHGADQVHLWDVEKKKFLKTLSHPQKRIAGAAFNAEGTQLLVWSDTTGQGGFGGWSSHFRVWDLSAYRPRSLFTIKYEKEINGASFAPDGKRILVWSDDRTARLWNVQQPELLRAIPLADRISGAVLNADASRVFAWSFPDSRVWDLESGKLLQTFKHDKFRGGLGGGVSNAKGTQFLTWSTNNTIGDEVELTHDQGFVWLWDMGRENPFHTLRHDGWVTAARFNAEGSRVLSASEDNTARLWEAETGRLLQTFRHEGDVNGAVFGPGESRILTWGGPAVDFSDQDKTVRLWDVKTGELLKRFPHPRVMGAKFNADGTRLLSWDRDEAKLWDVDSDQARMTFPRSSDGVLDVSFRVDTPWIVIPDPENNRLGNQIRTLWKSVKEMPVFAYQAPGSQRIVISRDLTRACALHDYPSLAEVFSLRLADPLCKLWTADHEGAEFSSNTNRLLTWGQGLQFWDIALRDERAIELQWREYEIRTATQLDDSGRTRVLPLQKWQEMLR